MPEACNIRWKVTAQWRVIAGNRDDLSMLKKFCVEET
jgi:hypothetical protein